MNKHSVLYYQFGAYRLTPSQRLLARGGMPVPLTSKAFETLLLLVENSGRLMDKEKLIKSIWPDTAIEDSTLSQNVFTVRKALGQTPSGRQYIETVPRHGYRFIEPVQVVTDEAEADEPLPLPAARPLGAGRAERSSKAINSLAVLPMKNVSGDPNTEYISDGVTESLIYNLSRVPQLRVMARNTVFRYKSGEEIDAQQIGRELGVSVVLVGRIFQLDDKISVRVELVDVTDGWHLWGEQYDRDFSDILTVQEDIARQISNKLRLKLTGAETARLTKRHTENPEAYRLYLRARYSWNKHSKEGYEQALEYSNQAIAVDPDYALAYTCLADCYSLLDLYGLEPPWETMPKAKAAVMRALELDDTLAEAYSSLGSIKMLYEWDWEGAEANFQKAIELNPDYPCAHQWRSKYLSAVGKIEESRKECDWALACDSYSPNANAQLGWHYFYARQYQKAVAQLEKTIEMEPNFYLSYIFCGQAYTQQGKYPDAIRTFEKARLLDEAPVVLGFLGHAYALGGEQDKAVAMLNSLANLKTRRYVPAYCFAILNTALGNEDQAFHWLEKACQDKNEWVGWIKVCPELDSLRPDPRFRQLLERMGLAG